MGEVRCAIEKEKEAIQSTPTTGQVMRDKTHYISICRDPSSAVQSLVRTLAPLLPNLALDRDFKVTRAMFLAGWLPDLNLRVTSAKFLPFCWTDTACGIGDDTTARQVPSNTPQATQTKTPVKQTATATAGTATHSRDKLGKHQPLLTGGRWDLKRHRKTKCDGRTPDPTLQIAAGWT